MRTGSSSSCSASACTAGGNVAENSRFWRRAGAARARARARRRSRARAAGRPRRARGSPRDESRSAFWSTRSSRRPGVATTMSAPPRSAIICGLIETPPTATQVLSGAGDGARSVAIASAICAASSRVGTRTSARTGRERSCPTRARAASELWRIGRTNAAVLPEPVCAEAQTSRPARIAGMAAAWTGVGASYSSSATARTSGADRPSEANGVTGAAYLRLAPEKVLFGHMSPPGHATHGDRRSSMKWACTPLTRSSSTLSSPSGSSPCGTSAGRAPASRCGRARRSTTARCAARPKRPSTTNSGISRESASR